MGELSPEESRLAAPALEDQISKCFGMIVLPGESGDPDRSDQVFIVPGSTLKVTISLRFDVGREEAFEMTVRDDGSGIMSNGSWCYMFGRIRESNAVELAAAAIRDSCVVEVMCS